MRLSKEALQKIKEKYSNYDDNFNPYDKIAQFMENHPDLQFDEDYVNNDDLIEFMALSLAVMREKPSERGKIILAENRMKFDYGVEFDFLTLINHVDEIDEIEDFDEKGQPVMMAKPKFAKSDDSFEEDLVDTNLFEVNDIFNKQTMLKAQQNMQKSIDGSDRIGRSLLKYEKNKDNKISISEAINLKLDNLTTAKITSENLKTHQSEAAELLSMYSALQKRSENRTFLDVLKHPFKTFSEWLAKGKVKDTLKERYGMNDKQLDYMSKLVGEEIVPNNYKGINKDGKIVDDDNNILEKEDIVAKNTVKLNSLAKDDEELDYDQLSADSSFSSEISEKSEFHEEKQIDEPNISIDDK